MNLLPCVGCGEIIKGAIKHVVAYAEGKPIYSAFCTICIKAYWTRFKNNHPHLWRSLMTDTKAPATPSTTTPPATTNVNEAPPVESALEAIGETILDPSIPQIMADFEIALQLAMQVKNQLAGLHPTVQNVFKALFE